MIAGIAIVIVLVGFALALLQLAEPISQIPPIKEIVGTFASPVHLPWWRNLIIGLCVAAASVERARWMRARWLDDLAT